MTKRKKDKINMQIGIPKTKDPLTIGERKRLLAGAIKVKRYMGLDAHKTCMIFMYTGMHVSVLSNTAKSRVHITDDNKIRWNRPKKEGSPSVTSIPLHKDIEPWIREYINDPNLPDFRRAYWLVVKKSGEKAGIKGVSPMTLRHTFAVILDEMGFTPAEIMLMLNCTLRVLMRYTRRTMRELEEKMAKRGWGNVPSSVTDINGGGADDYVKLDSNEDPEFRYHYKTDTEWKT